MTDREFFEWMAAYKLRFLGPAEQDAFVLTWKPDILQRELGDMIAAIADVAADPRPEARFPRQHFRLLLEHADARAAARKPGWKDPLAGEAPPERGSAWNRWMLTHGVITKKEFETRERAKEKSA